MARKPLPELLEFLKPFTNEVQNIALYLREFILDIYPDTNELIYDNYNALAIGYSLSDKQKEMFCHIAVYSKYVNMGFDQGINLFDPDKILEGTGNRIRHVTVRNINTFQKEYLSKLLTQANNLALEKLTEQLQEFKGHSIVKSISASKKRPI